MRPNVVIVIVHRRNFCLEWSSLLWHSIRVWSRFIFIGPSDHILLDASATHSWKDAWVAKDEQKWYYALLAIPVVCYIIAFTLSGILFIWFNPSGQDCGLNVFFLVMTMILAFAFAVIALHPQLHYPLLLSLLCKHSPSATLDILILILILGLFSGTFLITSYFSYIFQSLSLLLPPLSHSSPSSSSSAVIYLIGFLLFFILVFVFFEICCGYRSRTCENPRCKALKKAMEFDLQLQAEECLRSAATAVREIDELPWKGGSEGNPDYECLRAELRKMAPPNGRAVLLFRARCGYPIAKLKDWGAKRGRRHKKGLAPNGGGVRR
ncbi:uncharacterized protein At5g19025-like [Camellia sinensis]|uniref:uncharacterized protein At5g19025-like n=1 Tax=Camellia sinensis TaxID=4442 RepID=UPI0010369245|nr:uncharacterized protein At5g19025-like [Camellia sinensis]